MEQEFGEGRWPGPDHPVHKVAVRRRIIGPRDDEVDKKVREVIALATNGDHLTTKQDDLLEMTVRLTRPMLLVEGSVAPMSPRNAKTFPDWVSFVETVNEWLGSVGRIDLRDEASTTMKTFATAFLITTTLAATNRHVADRLVDVAPSDRVITFGMDGLTDRSPAQRMVESVVEISQDFDLAVLKLDRAVRAFPTFSLSSYAAPIGRHIAVAGFPAPDPETEVAVDHLLGGVYDRLRLSPGKVIGAKGDLMFHDCSTFSGSSGSPVLDMETGHVIGVQVDGSYMVQNEAVQKAAMKYLEHARDR